MMRFFLMLAAVWAGLSGAYAVAAEKKDGGKGGEGKRSDLEQAVLGSFSWRVPPGWEYSLSPLNVILSPPQEAGDKGPPMLVRYTYTHKTVGNLAELKAAMDAEIAKNGSTAGPEDERDSCELVALGGQTVARTRAKVWQMYAGEKYVYRMVSFVTIGEIGQEEVMVAAPADTYARWKDQVASIAATVTTRSRPSPGAKAETCTAGPFSFEIAPGWWSLRGAKRAIFMQGMDGEASGMTVTYATEQVQVAGAQQLLEPARLSLESRAAVLRDLVGVIKGTGGLLKKEDIHTPSVEVFRSGGVDLVKGRCEELQGAGDRKYAVKSVALLLPDGPQVHTLVISSQLEMLDVVAQENTVASVKVNAKGLSSPAASAAGQVFKSGPLECTLPGDWLKTTDPSIMCGPNTKVLGADVQTAVIAVQQPNSYADLKQMKVQVERRMEGAMTNLRGMVGGAIGADGGLRLQELKNPQVELLTAGKSKMLRLRAMDARELNGVRFMVETVECWVISGDKLRGIQIITPLATKEGALVDRILASMKLRE